jgi:hypothetical protein
MTENADRFQEQWIPSPSDPTVEFLITPLKVRQRTFILTNNIMPAGFDADGTPQFATEVAGEAIDIVRLSLKGVRRNGEAIKLDFSREKIGGRVMSVVSDLGLETLQDFWIYEIRNAVRDIGLLSDSDKTEIKNTLDSPSETSSVPETSPDVPVAPES